MKEVIVRSQKDFDKLPQNPRDYTRVIIRDTTERVYVNRVLDNSSVVAQDNSSVVAQGNSSVEAWGNSSVVARDNSSVVARDNSSVVAWENSSVEAWDNSSVVAWENSSVEAWDNSSVEAWDNVCSWAQSDYTTIAIYGFAVAYQLAKNATIKKCSKTATVITPKYKAGVDGWLEKEGIKKAKFVILYKRVTEDWKTQKGGRNETVWALGKTLEHPSWNPKQAECGEGKFHACSTPYFCDKFMSGRDDRYVAIKVAAEDLYAWPDPQYPHKIAFRKGKVMYECDKLGRKK